MQITKSTLPIKLGAVAGLGLLFLIVYILNPSFWGELWDVCLSGDMHRIAGYINSFGAWAMVFSFFLVLCVNAIGFPPAMIFSAANALIFGIVPGIALAWIAETAGCALSFVLLRFLFRDAAESVISKHKSLQKIDDFSGARGFRIMLIARIIPYMPSGLLNALGAVSRLSLKEFTVAALIGKLPSTAIEAMIGHDVVTAGENPHRLVFSLVLAVVMVLGFIIYEKRQKQKESQN